MIHLGVVLVNQLAKRIDKSRYTIAGLKEKQRILTLLLSRTNGPARQIISIITLIASNILSPAGVEI